MSSGQVKQKQDEVLSTKVEITNELWPVNLKLQNIYLQK